MEFEICLNQCVKVSYGSEYLMLISLGSAILQQVRVKQCSLVAFIYRVQEAFVSQSGPDLL